MTRQIAMHEFLTTIKRPAYYLVTFGMPLIFLGVGLLAALAAAPAIFNELQKLSNPIGIVDESGVLTGPGGILHDVAVGQDCDFEHILDGPIPAEEAAEHLEALGFKLPRERVHRFADLASAKPALAAGQLQYLFVVPPDFIATGEVQMYTREPSLLQAAEQRSSSFLQSLLAESMLRQARVPDQISERIQQSPRVVAYELGPDGEFVQADWLSKGLAFAMPLSVMGILLLALMMNASLLIASVAEEKENKMIEVLLSSVSAKELLFGKVLAQCAASLLQIAIWLAMSLPLPLLMGWSSQVELKVNVAQLFLAGAFTVLGFFFYGCLLAGLGSLASSSRDCQQLTFVVILLPLAPLLLIHSFLTGPNSIVPRVLSLIPLFSPTAMTLRLSMADVPLWEVASSLVLLMGSIWWGAKLSGKLFRAGTLMYGKRPGVVQIWRILREPT